MSDQVTGDSGVSAEVMAHLLDVSTARVYVLAKDGTLPKNEYGKFKLEGIRHVSIRHRAEIADAGERKERQRLTRVRADVEEAKHARMLGEVVPADEAVSMMSAIVAVIRTRFLSLPSRCAPRMMQIASATEAAEIIREEVSSILTYLAQAVDAVMAEIVSRQPAHRADGDVEGSGRG